METSLRQWLESQHTDPDISGAIQEGVSAWMSNRTPAFGNWSLEAQSVAQSQTNIGWNNFLLGLVATDWGALQQRYYDCMITRKTGLSWTKALVRRIWQIAWALWADRNDHVAKIRKEHDTLINEAVTNLHLQTLYNRGLDQILEAHQGSHRRFFAKTLAYLLKQSIEYKRSWIASVELVSIPDSHKGEENPTD